LSGWRIRKEDNIRALISTINLALWEGVDYKPPSLAELVTPQQVFLIILFLLYSLTLTQKTQNNNSVRLKSHI